MNLYEKSAAELSAMLKNKDCSAVEIANSVFGRIDETDEKVNAYLTICKESALEKAASVDNAIANGEKLSALAGIPIAVKDNLSTKGIRTTCASRILENYVPPFNASVIEKINASDMVIAGKLNMDEFAMGSSTENSFFKKTSNPFGLDRVPGGSSGGSAAAVAARECIVALGSDTGGSIRQPASYCGVIGLKPTYSSVSRYGLVAFASSLDQIGPIGTTVTDVAMLYSVICGYDKMDATTSLREYPDFAANLSADVKGLKIGIPSEYFGDGIDASVKEAVNNSVKELEKNGAVVKQISLPSTEHAIKAYYIISSAEASSNLARFDGVKYGFRAENYDGLVDMYERTRSEGFGDEVKRRIMLGTFVLSSGYYDAYYKRAKLLQRKIKQEFNEVFRDVDVIITPTAPSKAFKIGENAGNPLKMYAADVCTVPINIAGLPAISLPCGFDGGMPLGMQIIGREFGEQALLNTSYAYEKVMGGLYKMPEIKQGVNFNE